MIEKIREALAEGRKTIVMVALVMIPVLILIVAIWLAASAASVGDALSTLTIIAAVSAVLFTGFFD